MSKNIWLDGMMGLVTGDALGNPVQFMRREDVRARGPVTTMEAGGVYHTPAGTWTDDSSMALAALESIREIGEVVLEDIMIGFQKWYFNGEYTPFGTAFDMGGTCSDAIENFKESRNWRSCGMTGEYSNGNGALMRILPVCIHYIERLMNGEQISDEEVLSGIHDATSLTHNTLRAKIADGLYYFMAYEVACGEGDLTERLQRGIDRGFAFYKQDMGNLTELSRYGRLRDLSAFRETSEADIRSTGYVVDTLEAAVWSLLNTTSYRDALIKAVNLGHDADSVGAVTGGLAGLYYGYENIPEDWLAAIQRRAWIEEMCTDAYVSEIPVADIHAHLIPNLDDGSRSMEMTMRMIRSAYRQGVRVIVCTPHADYLPGSGRLMPVWDELTRRCAQAFPDLKLALGSEALCSTLDLEDGLARLERGKYLSMNGTKFVLTEFYQKHVPFDDLKACVTALKQAGWIPIIAHTEHYMKNEWGMEEVRWLKENGCKLQINLYSIKDDPDEERRAFVRQMLEARLVDYLGTDAHRMNHRPPKVANGMKELLTITDPEYARQIAYENACRDFGLPEPGQTIEGIS